MNNIKQRIEELLKAMSRGAYEREEVISLALLSAIAGESIFLLGLPGVGKSMVSRRLKMAFRDTNSFEYLMSRFSTPDEIFGPVSISKLKDEDTYERVIDGYLPTADIVFLDEIWKAGPAIQNSLLTALNERIFRNGNHDIKLPLKSIISASNELPAEGEGLEALWDRFLVRYIVQPITTRSAFIKLLTLKDEEYVISDELQFSKEECEIMQKQKDEIIIPEIVFNIICDIRDVLSNKKTMASTIPTTIEPPYVSDRRWRKIIGILRASAMLNGRFEVNPSDCLLLEHLLWDSDDQIPSIKRLVADKIVARIGEDIPRTVTIDEMEDMSFTEPVGELLSLDGVNYIFTAGGEDILISKKDYGVLNKNVSYGNLTADNKLVLTNGNGTFSIRKEVSGSIILNSFTYKLKRESSLRTGNTTTLLKTVNATADKVISGMKFLIEENIFLRPSSTYHELNSAFDNLRLKKSHFKSRL